ncbi:cupin domain protein [Diplodia corticola]|uniref:Cupin domain protein n=1 Tax=Diplodia corticola TaxID=236234 RepID=A0A1J9R0M2_9PEZI|nr:cupin domain protein [Diplodia corticola]OJD34918.1 cupin domain protein [Diplodia corticola]
MSADKNIRATKRFITGHDKEGREIFHDEVDEAAPMVRLPGDADFALCYATKGYPIDMSDNKDIATYQSYLTDLPGITISGGSVLRMVDMPPGATSPMHRTVSLDYGVVLEGEIELMLDSGEKRVMKRGDISIQRGTNHAWRNLSDTQWGRMVYILLPVQPIKVGDQVLGEASDIPGVKPSE